MFEVLLASLIKWNSVKNERQKLQHSYIVFALLTVLLAGIISLFNASLGHKIVLVALGSIGAFVAKAILWNLLKSSLIERLQIKPKRK